jgi:DNA-binding XRE family transcriptional regulator
MPRIGAHDRAAVARFDAMLRDIGLEEVERLSYSDAEVGRILDGTSPIAIWRERRGMTQRGLAEAAGISASDLAEIETGKKPGSIAVLTAIAKVLGVPVEHVVG